MACHPCYIYPQHNLNRKTQLCITYGFDIDLSTPESDDDHFNTNDDTITDPVIEKCSFQRNTICLPPDIAFKVHLLSEMNEHRGNDLNIFNQVI